MRQQLIPKRGSGKVRKFAMPASGDRSGGPSGAEVGVRADLRGGFLSRHRSVSGPTGGRTTRSPRFRCSGMKGYRWVLGCRHRGVFDSIDHTALMDRMRLRISDKRVLALVKAFLKAGVIARIRVAAEDSLTGTPQGGILSPLLANIALSVLDEHFDAQSAVMEPRAAARPGVATGWRTWRMVRYADDFVVLVFGTQTNAEAVREEVSRRAGTCGTSPVRGENSGGAHERRVRLPRLPHQVDA